METDNFFIIGNGGGGTSLLRGLLNAHPSVTCVFEDKAKDIPRVHDKINYFKATAVSEPLLWGNKVPIEQLISTGWDKEDIVCLAEFFKVIHIVRRYSMYWQGRQGPYLKNWNYSNEIYQGIREAYPARVIQVSFEDLLLRTRAELMRLCDFLGISARVGLMIRGTRDTGYNTYDQEEINKSRV